MDNTEQRIDQISNLAKLEAERMLKLGIITQEEMGSLNFQLGLRLGIVITSQRVMALMSPEIKATMAEHFKNLIEKANI